MRNLIFLTKKSDNSVLIPVPENIEFFTFLEEDYVALRIQSSYNLNGITLKSIPVTYLGDNTTEIEKNWFFSEVIEKVQFLVLHSLVEYFQDEAPDDFIETDLLLKRINDIVEECQEKWILKHCFSK